jgi:lysophospholipase L1-like esterase
MRIFQTRPSLVRIALFSAMLGLLAGCTDDPPSGTDPGLGGKAVAKYAAIGNSLTAGYQSSALYESGQMYSYPNLIAQQLKKAGATLGSFEQPIYSDPGNPGSNGKAARFELISILGPLIGPRGLTPGTPTNATLTRPYDNLGLPGAPLAGFLDTTGTYHGGFGPVIVRSGSGFPASPYQQLQLLSPDLVTFWLGANDVLGYATSGGVSPSAPTPSATFTALYTQSLDALKASLPNASVIVATIPEVSGIPFFTTIAGNIKANPTASAAFAAGGSFYFQQAGDLGAGTGSTKFEGGANDPLVTLLGGLYVFSIGIGTYAPYRSLGAPYDNYAFAQSVGIDSTKPFGLDPANPFPNVWVLDAGEQTTTTQAIAAYNASIISIASARGYQVWDAHALFNDISSNGYFYKGYKFTTDFVTGGLFSLDGVHPTSRGYGIMANELIGVMNKEYGMSIPIVDILAIPGLEAPPLSKSSGRYAPGITEEGRDDFLRLFRPMME